MKILIALLVATVSMVVPVQVAAINRFRTAVHSTPFAVGVALAVGAVTVLGFSMTGILGRVELQRIGGAPWWVWSAGLLLGILMVVQTEGLAAGGAGAAMAATVAGQLIAGLIVDHFGWFDVQRVSMNGWRIAGAVLVVGGAVLMQRR